MAEATPLLRPLLDRDDLLLRQLLLHVLGNAQAQAAAFVFGADVLRLDVGAYIEAAAAGAGVALLADVLTVLIGEGGSGGALALAVSDEVWMLENSVYSVISPEGCASILWKDSSKAADAAEALRLTAQDLFDLGVIERIIRQPKAGDRAMFESLKMLIKRTFEKNLALDDEELLNARYERFRKIGKP